MSTNFFDPAFRVIVNDTRLSLDVSRNILQVNVVSELDTSDHFSLTLTNPYPTMPWTHTDKADLFQLGNSVRIEMGYVDNLQTLFQGEITSLSPTFPESGVPTLEISGRTQAHRLQGS